ncbi:MAG: response regulator transcription factor [Candidatus Krumholzibacteriia bacterium]
MNGARILLVEDDPNLGLIIRESLEREGYLVTHQPDGEAGLAALQGASFDLCLVDVMMPRLDGFGFARHLAELAERPPFIFITAKSLSEHKVTGFRLGCDDYVTKPFSLEELLVRMEAVLARRGAGHAAPDPTLAIGRYTFDTVRQVLTLDGTDRALTTREAELLTLLHQYRGRTLDRSLALGRIWGADTYHAGRSMDVFVSRLRKYLTDDPAVEIRTVHGRGFKLIVGGAPRPGGTG